MYECIFHIYITVILDPNNNVWMCFVSFRTISIFWFWINVATCEPSNFRTFWFLICKYYLMIEINYSDVWVCVCWDNVCPSNHDVDYASCVSYAWLPLASILFMRCDFEIILGYFCVLNVCVQLNNKNLRGWLSVERIRKEWIPLVSIMTRQNWPYSFTSQKLIWSMKEGNIIQLILVNGDAAYQCPLA